MNVQLKKLENSQVELGITVDADKFEEGMQKAFFRKAKQFEVPGFRKGKAPRNIVEKHYGEAILYEEAFNIIVPEIYEEAIKENNLEVVSRPEIDISQIGSGKSLIFTATVTIKPEVKLGKYKGLKIEKKEYKVTDEDVNNKVNEMAEKNARIIKADDDKILGLKDTAIIDFEGFVDDIAFEGGKAENHSLEIGSGTFIPGFEEKLIGMKQGEEKEITVKFPDNYFSQDLSGKDATFKVKLNEIKIKEMPKIDDEFAKDCSEFETLEELKNDIKEHLEEDSEKRAKFEQEESAIEQVLDKTEIDIPMVMIDLEIDNNIKDLENKLGYQGMTLDTYLSLIGKNIVNLRDQMKEKAIRDIKVRLTLEAIFKAEDLKITDEDINNKLSDFAKEYGRDTNDFVSKATDQMKEYVKEELKYDLAVKFIMDNSK